MRNALALIALATILCASAFGTPLTNVAGGANVTLTGVFGVRPSEPFSPPSADGSTLVDNIFLPGGTAWQDGTVWWDATNPGSEDNAVLIDLGGPYSIYGFVVQADDNDEYSIDYWTGTDWALAWLVPTNLYGGMRIRPNDTDSTEPYLLPSPITTNLLRVKASCGDCMFALSEVQAIGAPVPEPSTFALIGAGLTALGLRFRRKART